MPAITKRNETILERATEFTAVEMPAFLEWDLELYELRYQWTPETSVAKKDIYCFRNISRRGECFLTLNRALKDSSRR